MCLDPATKKIIITKNVIFDKSDFLAKYWIFVITEGPAQDSTPLQVSPSQNMVVGSIPLSPTNLPTPTTSSMSVQGVMTLNPAWNLMEIEVS